MSSRIACLTSRCWTINTRTFHVVQGQSVITCLAGSCWRTNCTICHSAIQTSSKGANSFTIQACLTEVGSYTLRTTSHITRNTNISSKIISKTTSSAYVCLLTENTVRNIAGNTCLIEEIGFRCTGTGSIGICEAIFALEAIVGGITGGTIVNITFITDIFINGIHGGTSACSVT